MAAPPSWEDFLADDEGTSFSHSGGLAHTSPTPPFQGYDPTTVGVSGDGAPGPGVAWRHRGLADDDLTAVALPGRSLNAMPGPPLIGDDTVEVSGDGAPPPAESFWDANLAEAVLRNVASCGFEIPTPLQRYLMPIVLAGRDVMACAETGSGKTAAFCIPVLSGLAAMDAAGRIETGKLRFPRLRALVLVPNNDRAKQIFDEANKFSFQTGLKLRVLYEGPPLDRQFRYLSKGADVLIATPALSVSAVMGSQVSLHAIRYLVMDKADMMIAMGFEPDMRKLVNDMNMPHSTLRQTLIFSETFRPEIQNLASEILANYILITVKKVETTTYLVRQKVDFIHDEEKRSHLLSLLEDQYVTVTCKLYQPLTLVFVETKREAVFLRNFLGYKGFLTAVIHGETTLQERENTLKSFRDGLTSILVATDAASRGLDFPKVAHVINYDLPKSIQDYAYRIGKAGKAASATAFFTESNHSLAKELIELMTEAKQDVPDWLEKYTSDPRVKVDVGCLHEKDELSHWMSQLLLEDDDETLEDDKSEDCFIEAGLQTLSCPRVSYEKTLENGIKWMSEECSLCFRKYVEQFPIEGTDHKFGELIQQCFNFDACGKIFHHYNFTVETKHKDSDLWIPQLYFAEVKEQAGVKDFFCCLLEASDNGHCYGCMNQHVDDLKHPCKGGYEAGNADIFWPFMDDFPDSDDDCESSS